MNISYNATVIYRYYGFGDYQLDDIEPGSSKEYICPYCEEVIAESKEGADRFFSTGIPEIRVRKASRDLRRRWMETLSKAVEKLRETCKERGYVLKTMRGDDGLVSGVELVNEDSGGFVRFSDLHAASVEEFKPLKSIDPASQSPMRQAVLLDTLAEELSTNTKGLRLTDMSAAEKLAILLLAKHQVFMNWRERAKAARMALEYGIRLDTSEGYVKEIDSRHAACERFLDEYLEMFGRDGLEEELVKAKPFKRNDLVKKLFPDNAQIFAEALEGDVSDDELRTLEEDLSQMEPRARAEVIQSLASKLTISAELFTRESMKKVSNFLTRYFRSASDEELATVLGVLLNLPPAPLEPEAKEMIRELLSRVSGTRVADVLDRGYGELVYRLEDGLEARILCPVYPKGGSGIPRAYEVEVVTHDKIINLEEGRLVRVYVPIDTPIIYWISPRHVEATRHVIEVARQYHRGLRRLVKKMLEDEWFLTLIKLKGIAGDCRWPKASGISTLLWNRDDVGKLPKMLKKLVEEELEKVNTSLSTALRRHMTVES